jgi:hypothetical protein
MKQSFHFNKLSYIEQEELDLYIDTHIFNEENYSYEKK